MHSVIQSRHDPVNGMSIIANAFEFSHFKLLRNS